MARDSNEVIFTAAAGLGPKALVGVYVEGDEDDAESVFNRHGIADTPFGTYSDAANLDKFANDRNRELTGAPDGTDQRLIVWPPQGTQKVILKKVGGSFEPLPGARFTIRRGKSDSSPGCCL